MRPVPALTRGPRETAELLERFGLRPDKSLGQHFLIDPNQVDRIVRLTGVGPGDRIVEVGPGLGALTAGLAAVGAHVVAVEVDRGLVDALRQLMPAVEVVHADALSVDWSELVGDDEWSMIANLPYNVATPLVLDVLDRVPQITSMLVMVQREVAERLAARPGTPAYGIPSIKVAYHGDATVEARVPSSVFLPRPRVESALVRIVRHEQPRFEESVDEVFELVRAAFGQRRKMVRRSLAAHVEPGDFGSAGISPDVRPEQLTVADWCALVRARTAREAAS